MTVVQKLPGTFTITDPDWPRFAMWTPGQVFTSDSFSEPGDLAGRMTDASLGGTPVRWVGDEGMAPVQDGMVSFIGDGTSGFVAVEVPAGQLDVSFTIAELATEGFITVFVLSDELKVNSEQIMFRLNHQGSAIVRDERWGDTLLLGSVNGVTAGDRFTIGVEGSTITMARNDTQVIEAQSRGPFAGRYVGIYKGRTTVGGKLDDFVITAR